MIYYIIKYIFYFPLRFIFFPAKIFNKFPKIKDVNGEKKTMMIAYNHFSFLDIPIVDFYSKRKVLFVAKKELKKNFLVRLAGFLFGVIYIDRGTSDLKAMKLILKALKDKKIVAMAPEGTRNKENDDIQELKEGISFICAKSDNCTIVPFVFLKKPRLFHKSYINIGTPIRLMKEGEKINKENLHIFTQRLQNHMENCKANLNAYYYNYKNRKAIKKGKLEALEIIEEDKEDNN